MKTRILNILSKVITLMLFCGLIYLGIAIRTARYGMTGLMPWPLMVGVFILFSTVCLIPLLGAGYSGWKSIGLIIGIEVTVFAVSEGVAGVEEDIFRRYCQRHQFTETVFRERWWPFRHHDLGYHPDTQQFFGGDEDGDSGGDCTRYGGPLAPASSSVCGCVSGIQIAAAAGRRCGGNFKKGLCIAQYCAMLGVYATADA